MMNRTYNFQVDNGIFVVEYYLKKEYKEITITDLMENIEFLAEAMQNYNNLSTLSYTSHLNTALTQGKAEGKEKRIKEQLKLLLNNIGNDRNCMICGEKRVNVSVDLPYSSFMYGLPSHNRFMNRGNNLKTVDVCPICLFYSMLSFLNTQKISYPFLYISDSDEFMRDITERIQDEISQNIMLDIKQTEMGQRFIPIMSELIDAREEGVYEDLNYVSLIQYANAKSNYYKESNIDKETLNFLLRIRDKGLINEFYKLGLFFQITIGGNLLRMLTKEKEVSIEMYELIKEEVMSKDEITLIEGISKKLTEQYGAENVLKELKIVIDKQGFRNLLLKYTSDIDFDLSLLQMDTVIQRYREYVDYIRLEIQMEEKRN